LDCQSVRVSMLSLLLFLSYVGMSFLLAANGPMLCAGPAKTAGAHCEAPCSNITQFSIEPPTAGLALSICYGRQMCITIIQDCSGFSRPFISLIKFLLSETASPQHFFR